MFFKVSGFFPMSVIVFVMYWIFFFCRFHNLKYHYYTISAVFLRPLFFIIIFFLFLTPGVLQLYINTIFKMLTKLLIRH